MGKNFYFYAAGIVLLVVMITGLIINSTIEQKKQTSCKEARIRPFAVEFFTWGGIVKISEEGKFQPKCL